MTHISPVHRPLPVFSSFCSVGPPRRPCRRLFQAVYIFFKPFVAALLHLLPSFKIHHPRGKVSALDLYIRSVYGQNMIHTPVKKASVMGNKYESFFSFEICGDCRSCRGIQMIGRLVYKRKTAVFKKHHRQQSLCPLTV